MKRKTLYCFSCGSLAPLHGYPLTRPGQCGTCVSRHNAHVARRRARPDWEGRFVVGYSLICGAVGLGVTW